MVTHELSHHRVTHRGPNGAPSSGRLTGRTTAHARLSEDAHGRLSRRGPQCLFPPAPSENPPAAASLGGFLAKGHSRSKRPTPLTQNLDGRRRHLR